ncbi:MAG: leucine--tRNA ligase, partial [Clostridia bacterium]|nr:leucine--tRNA ligase [Clostridia bacterium]
RETDTMPQWAGSSWYFLRYADPHNHTALASPEALSYWTPVDWYNGGMEHTTLHLLYSRFWHKFLFDIGVVPTKEPYLKRTSHGMILGENGEKMSKSRGNVVNPDEIIDKFGADTMRLYEMFIGDFEKSAPWNPQSIKGCRRFIERTVSLLDSVTPGDEYSAENESAMHKTIKKVSEDIESLKFNTAIAALMSLLNQLCEKGVNHAEMLTFVQLLNPFAPHITEELAEKLGVRDTLVFRAWPQYDESKTRDEVIEIAVQINGKVKSVIAVPVGAAEQEMLDLAYADEKVQAAITGMKIVKSIVVKNKIINIVVKPA